MISGKRNSNKLRIIVLGYIVRMPLGGLTWHYLQYVLGLLHLGHDVYYVEDSCFFENDPQPYAHDPIKNTHDDPSYGLQYAMNTFERVGLGQRWAYYDAITATWQGPTSNRMQDLCATADLVINVSGINPLRPWLMEIPKRLYVDTDPLFNQIRQLTNPINRKLASQHTDFLSFGENIFNGASKVPENAFPWQPTRQPIVLDTWSETPGCSKGMFTTVMAWEGYRRVEYKGVSYGLKSESFLPYLELPMLAGSVIELAMFHPSSVPIEKLRTSGWTIRNAKGPTRDPWEYQRYVQQSKAEFSVAKHAYVISRSGWFSERSVNYLASGRPVLVQDTGFTDWLPTGSGVIAFSCLEEAIAGIHEINSRYDFHCKSAREVAQAYFNADKVLTQLIETAFDTQDRPMMAATEDLTGDT